MRALLAAAVATLLTGPAAAASPDCPDAELLGPGLITNICWDCIFPIVIASAPLAFGDEGGPPAEAGSGQPLCVCDGPGGIPAPGITLGMWEPARLIEVVRTPGCSPLLMGTRIESILRDLQGSRGGRDYDAGDEAFYHYHLWAFPLIFILDLFTESDCVDDSLVDIDVLYFSELDPTWNIAELAFYLNPETAAVANPIAQAACLPDAVAGMAGETLDPLFWCAGSQSIYPLTGHHLFHSSEPRNTNLAAIRAIAALHRRGLMTRTMGSDALCEAEIAPFIPKSQYELSVAYPQPEANGRHAIGEPSLNWGEHRVIPGIGEDFVYLVWRWNDCCLTW